MKNVGIGTNFLAIKLIDWGYSTKYRIRKEEQDMIFKRGFTVVYGNQKYLDSKSNGKFKNKDEIYKDIYKNEFWCLGNTIIEIIKEFYNINNNKESKNTTNYIEMQEDMNEIRLKISEILLEIIDFCFCSDVLEKLKYEEKKIEEILEKKSILFKKFFNETLAILYKN